jgi:hypothetical protein
MNATPSTPASGKVPANAGPSTEHSTTTTTLNGDDVAIDPVTANDTGPGRSTEAPNAFPPLPSSDAITIDGIEDESIVPTPSVEPIADHALDSSTPHVRPSRMMAALAKMDVAGGLASVEDNDADASA